jgi:hypothetical protein
MCRRVENTGDLKWNTWSWEHHIECVCTKRGAQSKLHASRASEDGRHVRLVVRLMQEGH